jgi:hypothetical protein
MENTDTMTVSFIIWLFEPLFVQFGLFLNSRQERRHLKYITWRYEENRDIAFCEKYGFYGLSEEQFLKIFQASCDFADSKIEMHSDMLIWFWYQGTHFYNHIYKRGL